jgi:FkbH-like protein
VASLAGLSLFETTAYSEDDGQRARFYRENAKREEFSQTASDLSEYLTNLAMRATVGTVDGFSLPRIAQLINKSNQFHLTGTRYSEAEILALSRDPACDVLWFRLADRFGDNGLVSAVILRRRETELQVDTWVMSCRVLGRSMEEFIVNEIFAAARARQCASVVGTYRPSARNQLVADLYRKLGFDPAGTTPEATSWRRAVPADEQAPTTFVERVP